MKKIKVMHFVSGLVSGGVEEMLYNYCGHLDSNKYDFVVVYQHEPVQACIEKIQSVGCKTRRITARSENFLGNIKDSIKVIKEENPDIVHAHMNLMNFCALYAAKKCEVKVRISHSHIAEKNKNIFFRVMACICKKLCVFCSTSLFACGQEAGEYMYGNRLMNDGKVTIISNAIDLKSFKIDKQTRSIMRHKFNLEDRFVVGHVGRFSYQKNHERLINIFVELLKYKPNAILVLVGTGELEETIKNRVKELGVRDKVMFYGTTKQMKELYSMIDVFVLPSRFEGLPVVAIEVQAANIPSVFSDTIAPTCKMTNAVKFLSLDQSDEIWAHEIINSYDTRTDYDLRELYKQFDIRAKAEFLDNLYVEMLHD